MASLSCFSSTSARSRSTFTCSAVCFIWSCFTSARFAADCSLRSASCCSSRRTTCRSAFWTAETCERSSLCIFDSRASDSDFTLSSSCSSLRTRSREVFSATTFESRERASSRTKLSVNCFCRSLICSFGDSEGSVVFFGPVTITVPGGVSGSTMITSGASCKAFGSRASATSVPTKRDDTEASERLLSMPSVRLRRAVGITLVSQVLLIAPPRRNIARAYTAYKRSLGVFAFFLLAAALDHF
mmetsp:Transcript_7995/g.17178  ORF Transcript_7995/g.17178 Transcript_7995/m.17178 type:complete len:243 (-) Transcript_7995:72-800(-)